MEKFVESLEHLFNKGPLDHVCMLLETTEKELIIQERAAEILEKNKEYGIHSTNVLSLRGKATFLSLNRKKGRAYE